MIHSHLHLDSLPSISLPAAVFPPQHTHTHSLSLSTHTHTHPTTTPPTLLQENELGALSAWDRFAQAEYVRLASEEEEGMVGGDEDVFRM